MYYWLRLCSSNTADGDGETHDEVDVEEEADVEHEVRRTGHDESPHVQRPSDVQAVRDEQLRYDSVPDADTA